MKTIPQLQLTRALRLRGTFLAVLAALAFVGILTVGLSLVTPAARGPNANDGFTLVSGDTTGTVAVPAGGKALQGDAATARLKEQGHYESLMLAVQAARYAVETVKATPDTAPAGECYAGNRAQALRCWFRVDGLELQPTGARQSPWKLNLRLQGYGRTTLAAAEVGGVSARQNRVELSRANGAVVEWYENKAAGLEQGFTVLRPPQGGDGPLRLILETEGDLRSELETDEALSNPRSSRRESAQTPEKIERTDVHCYGEAGTAVKFISADGQAVLRYSGLKAWDAAQRELAAHFEVQGRQLALVINDRRAAEPSLLQNRATVNHEPQALDQRL